MDPKNNSNNIDHIPDDILAEIYAHDALLDDVESLDMFVGSKKPIKYIDASQYVDKSAPVYQIGVPTYDPKTSTKVLNTHYIDSSFKCMKSKLFFKKDMKKIIKFERSDGIILPAKTKEKIFQSLMTMHTVKLTNKKYEFSIYCRVVGFDAPENCVILPRWIMNGIFLESGDNVHINTVNMPEVKSLKVSVDKKIEDPKTILEYELKDHIVSFVGKTIKIKMFEKEYEIKVVSQEPCDCGIISNIDVKLEIE